MSLSLPWASVDKCFVRVQLESNALKKPPKSEKMTNERTRKNIRKRRQEKRLVKINNKICFYFFLFYFFISSIFLFRFLHSLFLFLSQLRFFLALCRSRLCLLSFFVQFFVCWQTQNHNTY